MLLGQQNSAPCSFTHLVLLRRCRKTAASHTDIGFPTPNSELEVSKAGPDEGQLKLICGLYFFGERKFLLNSKTVLFQRLSVQW
jgi:hypothetical protein